MRPSMPLAALPVSPRKTPSLVPTTNSMAVSLPCSVVVEPLGVDEDERHAAGAVAAVRPGVVRAALDEHVACAHQRFPLVQHSVHLAFEDNRVIDGIGLMKTLLARPALAADLGAAALHLLGAGVAPTFGRHVDDAKDAAAAGGGR